MASVRSIRPDILDIHVPAPIRDLPIFLCWRYEARREGDPKPPKLPYYPLGGRRVGQQGGVEDRARLTTFAVARDEAAKRGMSGVGIALLPGYDLVSLDVDNCVADGQIPADVMAAVAGTYVEYSPSGKGIRALFHGDLGNRKSPTTSEHYGLETFSSSGFCTLTGAMLPHVDLVGLEDTIGSVNPTLEQLCTTRFGSSAASQKADPDDFMAGREPRVGMTPEEIEAALDKLDPGCGRDQWITVGMALHHECEGDDTGFEIWDSWSSLGDNYVSREDLEKQWASFDRRAGSLNHTVTMRSVLKMVKDLAPIASPDDLKAATEEGKQLADPDQGVRTPEGYDGKFPVLSASDLAARPPASWHIKGILPQADVVILFGASTAGKSFVAIELGAAVARGMEWRQRRVKKGRVILIAAEGSGGIGKRLEAYAKEHGISADDLDIGVIIVPPNFCEKEDMAELAKAIAAAGGGDIIIVDTFAQVTPGANENSGEDMGLALANCRVLHDATGATVVLVHHAGKDLSKGSRGWSGLKAAADAEIEISRHEDGYREIHISKMKDGEDGLRFGFTLDVVEMGIDADGDTITSCVVREAEPRQEVAETRAIDKVKDRLGPIERVLIETAEEDFPADSRAGYDAFLEAAMARMPEAEDGKRDTRRQRAVRALQGLSAGKNALFGINNGNVLFYID